MVEKKGEVSKIDQRRPKIDNRAGLFIKIILLKVSWRINPALTSKAAMFQ